MTCVHAHNGCLHRNPPPVCFFESVAREMLGIQESLTHPTFQVLLHKIYCQYNLILIMCKGICWQN